MLLPRIIPVLLIKNNGLYKTTKFKNPKYIGDPINAVKVFNEKEVDELIILDYNATIEKRSPSYILIEHIASQCFMPVCYGGGIRSVDDIKRIIGLGVEKIAFNTIAAENPAFLEKAATIFGSSTIVVSIDSKKNRFGNYNVYTRSGQKSLRTKPEIFAKQMENCGAGELLINSISRDGTMQGYDLELINLIAAEVKVPIIACGGAGEINHFRDAYDNGASAMAAGSFFVFHGKHRGVLISYPSQENLENLFHQQTDCFPGLK
jgi:cyclase